MKRFLVFLAGLFVFGLPIWCMIAAPACSNPPTPAETVKFANDLCGLRAIERAVLELDPTLAPPPDSLRAKVQATEDALCAATEDAGAPPPAPS